MGSFALKSTEWVLDIATRFIKASIRVHNVDALTNDMAILFVVNHFTRLETILMPYVLKKHAGLAVWSLAAADLFVGQVGKFLLSTGNVSTKDPDRDKIIIHSLLAGRNPWIIFPEGALIKDKKLVDHRGAFSVFNKGERRPPHTGAAVLALRTEFYRRKLHCLASNPDYQDALDRIRERFSLESVEEALSKRTVVVPVNITYFPIRSSDNVFLRLARRVAQEELSDRAVEELSVEGTVLSHDTDIDITFGEPIDVHECLEAPEYEGLMACGPHDVEALEEDPRSLFNDAARGLMRRHMDAIYGLTLVNHDHVTAALLRYQRSSQCSGRLYRNRVYLAIDALKRAQCCSMHPSMGEPHDRILFEEDTAHFDDFMDLCVRQGVLRKEGETYFRLADLSHSTAPFHTARQQELINVIANEIEPLAEANSILRVIAQTPDEVLLQQVRKRLVDRELETFSNDYAEFAITDETKPEDVGRPFLLLPERLKGGVVLMHGFLAAPLEVRALAEFLAARGYAVYGVRLAGHGTAPEDLGRTSWRAWYESMNRGYAIMKTITANVTLGGFSTGGTLALLGAARKGERVRSVFTINAPLQLRNYGARFASSVMTMNTLLSRFNMEWEYVPNEPENPHINYVRTPIQAVSELNKLMGTTQKALDDICVPTMVMQARDDPTVDPASAQAIFDRLGVGEKDLVLVDRNTHGIINGEGSEEVFERIEQLLEQTRQRETKRTPAPRPQPITPMAELVPAEAPRTSVGAAIQE
ncbi:MAG: alpha/beta fold hydrolase [bacterium]|nr:alpha/beta fold hydrolase [bacterium]